MLTEALRSFVMRIAWEMDQGGSTPRRTSCCLMNFSTDVIQRVTALEHGASTARPAGYDERATPTKLVRDGIIWTHLAGDASQRLKVIRRLMKG